MNLTKRAGALKSFWDKGFSPTSVLLYLRLVLVSLPALQSLSAGGLCCETAIGGAQLHL